MPTLTANKTRQQNVFWVERLDDGLMLNGRNFPERASIKLGDTTICWRTAELRNHGELIEVLPRVSVEGPRYNNERFLQDLGTYRFTTRTSTTERSAQLKM